METQRPVEATLDEVRETRGRDKYGIESSSTPNETNDWSKRGLLYCLLVLVLVRVHLRVVKDGCLVFVQLLSQG